MACYDLKDFFLSGSSSELANDVSSGFSGAKVPLIKQSTFFLLENQFVVAESLPHVYRCFLGSGMGLGHSGHISNLAFYRRVERRLLAKYQSDPRVIRYIRYFDDIFVLFDGADIMHEFARALNDYAAYFVIEERQVSQNSVQYLDLTITVKNDKLVIEPTLNKMPKPLCPTSAHPMHVHASWPGAVSNRIRSLADSEADSLGKLFRNYELANAHPFTLDRLCQPPATSSRSELTASTLTMVPMVMRYHPVFRSAVATALRLASVPEAFRARITPCWINALPSLSIHIRKHNTVLRNDVRVSGLGRDHRCCYHNSMTFVQLSEISRGECAL